MVAVSTGLVTITGGGAGNAVLAFDSSANAILATQIAAAIAAAITSGAERGANALSGPPPPLGGKTGLFIQNVPGVSSLPRGYADVVNSAANAVIFGSGDPNEHILSGSGNLTFYGRGGSGTVVTGGGNNLISIPVANPGNWRIQTGGGTDTIIDRGAGFDTISPGLGANAVTLGGGTYLVASSGQDTVTQGSGNVTIDASAAPQGATELVFAGAGNLRFIGGAGSATIVGGAGSETVTGGSGPLSVTGGSAGHNLLIAGTGVATLFGGGDGDTLMAAGGAPQLLRAGTGNETLTGGTATGADTFVGGAGKDQITGGLGADTYVAGTGQATVSAAGSSNLFEFISGSAGGTTLVNGLTNASQVQIRLMGYGANEAAAAIAGQVAGANSVTLTLSDNTAVTFTNITHLNLGNFGFV